MRIYMNRALAAYTLSGKTVDVGGGHHPDYFDYFQKASDTSIETIDASISGIDFENDSLPYPDRSVDTVICANVLEHVYDHRFLVREIRRILKANGQVIGFVPFFIQYHPDPHDYFRYTKEALARIFADAGFLQSSISPVGGGPLLVNFNTIMLSLPRLARPLFFIPYSLLDTLFLWLRPKGVERYPLGFVFTASTPT